MSGWSGTRCLTLCVIAMLPLAVAHAELPLLDWTATISPKSLEVVPPGRDFPQTLQFGEAVAISGSRAVAGMPSYNNARGKAAVFTRNAAGEWRRTASLSAPDAIEGDAFGQAVILEGKLAVVGSARAIYVFRNNKGVWSKTQRLAIDADEWLTAAMDYQSGVLVAGAAGGDVAGAVYVFQLGQNGKFQRRNKLVAPSGVPEDEFGSSVALWSGTVVIGAPGHNASRGAAYVFRHVGRHWFPMQTLVSADGESFDRFGAAVAASGNTLVIGAPNHDFVTPGGLPIDYVAGGAAYVYKQRGWLWAESQKLRPTPDENPWYASLGTDVQVMGDRIAVSAPWGWTRFDQGYVFVYQQSGRNYVPTAMLSGQPSVGEGLSLSRNAIVAGVPWDPVFSIGFAYIHEL
jgi:hypothetical protein